VEDGHKFSVVKRLSRDFLIGQKVQSLLPNLRFEPPLGVILLEFHRDLSHHKTGVPELSCTIVCMIPCLAILELLRLVTDGQMDMQ